MHIRICPFLPPHTSPSPEKTLLCFLTPKPCPQGTGPDYFGMSTRTAQLLSFSSQKFLIRVLFHCSHHNIYRKASNPQNNVLRYTGDFWCQRVLKILVSSSKKPEDALLERCRGYHVPQSTLHYCLVPP